MGVVEPKNGIWGGWPLFSVGEAVWSAKLCDVNIIGRYGCRMGFKAQEGEAGKELTSNYLLRLALSVIHTGLNRRFFQQMGFFGRFWG